MSSSKSPRNKGSDQSDSDSDGPGKKKGKKYDVYLLPSIFPNRPSTVLFSLEDPKTIPSAFKYQHDSKDKKDVGLYYRLGETATKFSVVCSAFRRAGFSRTSTSVFNLMWTRHPKSEEYGKLNEYQRVNHFPGTWGIGRKDNLARNLVKMKRLYGAEEYGFFPRTYLLPTDLVLLQSEYERNPDQTFIVKPNASSCGKGIYLIHEAADIKKTEDCLVQQYISDPFLIDGYKLDLRIYVVVTNFDPLRIYMLDDGLTRFCTEKYTGPSKKLKTRFAHLTNYSVNKKAKKFVWNTDADADDVGSKWSLKAFRRYLAKQGVDVPGLWSRIHDVVIKTILSVESDVASQFQRCTQSRNVCFELFGFDIMLDSAMKPWLIEVNIMPSLNSGSPLDKRIKSLLLTDLYHMVGIVPYGRKKHAEDAEAKKQNRLLGIPASKTMASGSGTVRKRTIAELTRGPLSELTEFDREVLMDVEDEYRRRGHFERIFPTPENVDYYSQFFECPRYTNVLLAKWIKERRSAERVPAASPISPSARGLGSPPRPTCAAASATAATPLSAFNDSQEAISQEPPPQIDPDLYYSLFQPNSLQILQPTSPNYHMLATDPPSRTSSSSGSVRRKFSAAPSSAGPLTHRSMLAGGSYGGVHSSAGGSTSPSNRRAIATAPASTQHARTHSPLPPPPPSYRQRRTLTDDVGGSSSQDETSPNSVVSVGTLEEGYQPVSLTLHEHDQVQGDPTASLPPAFHNRQSTFIVSHNVPPPLTVQPTPPSMRHGLLSQGPGLTPRASLRSAPSSQQQYTHREVVPTPPRTQRSLSTARGVNSARPASARSRSQNSSHAAPQQMPAHPTAAHRNAHTHLTMDNVAATTSTRFQTVVLSATPEPPAAIKPHPPPARQAFTFTQKWGAGNAREGTVLYSRHTKR